MKNKFLTFLLSLVLAFGLWFYVITVISPNSEETYYVPVIMEGERVLNEKGMMLTSDTNQTVTLQLSGNRTDLNKLNNSNINVIVDLTRIYEPGNKMLQYSVSYPGDIPDNAVEVQSMSPSRLYVSIEEKVTKNVPVKIAYSGSVKDGYITDKENAILNYPTVAITGPSSIMEQIDAAYIAVNLSGRSESISEDYKFTLCNKEGQPVDLQGLVTTTVTEVRLDLKIELVKELELLLEVIDGGGATEETSLIKIDPGVIRVSGSELLLNKLDSIILGQINLGELTQDTKLEFPIELPEGITNLSGMDKAVVNVSFPKLQKREFTVTNIQAVNIPEGMEADIFNEALTVVLRGPSAEISAMTANDIVVTVDFRDVEMGTATIKATIVISEKYADVGAIGTYSVSATLQEPVPETTGEG